MPGQTKSKTTGGKKQKKGIKKGSRRNQSPRKDMIFQNVVDTVEKKNSDTESSLTVPLSSAFSTPVLINGIAQGTSPGQHIGRRALMKSLQIRYIATPGTASNISQVRAVLVYDKQTNAATPAVTDIMQSSVFTSPIALANKDRFVVLMDEVSPIMPSTSQCVSGSRYMKMNLPITYNGSTASTVSAIQTGAIWLLVANNSDPIGFTSTFYYYSRVRFTDE